MVADPFSFRPNPGDGAHHDLRREMASAPMRPAHLNGIPRHRTGGGLPVLPDRGAITYVRF